MNRREFIAGMTAAGISGSAGVRGQSAVAPPVKTTRTKILEIGYHESGPITGFPVFLLHGFPDDAHAYDGVAPVLAQSGYRALAIYLRGYGPTRFLDAAVPRTAEQAAIGQDVIDLADALSLPRIAVCGFDWGGRACCIAAALHPDRVRAAVLCGGYTIQNTTTPGPPLPPAGVRNNWYQWYFNTDVEKHLATRPKITVPTVLLHGNDDGFGRPAPTTTDAERAAFTSLVGRHVVEGAGHFVPHEKPDAVASAVLEVLAASS